MVKILIYLNLYVFNMRLIDVRKTLQRWFRQDRNVYQFWGIVFGNICIILRYSAFVDII